MLPISGCKDRLIRRTLRRVYRFCHFCPCGKRVYPLGKRNSVSQTAGKRTVHAPCSSNLHHPRTITTISHSCPQHPHPICEPGQIPRQYRMPDYTATTSNEEQYLKILGCYCEGLAPGIWPTFCICTVG